MKNLGQKINDIHLHNNPVITDYNDFSFESFQTELEGLDVADLYHRLDKLNIICSHFDPFIPVVDDEIIPLISEFNLSHLTHNPFQFTNTLLRILSMLEAEIKKRLH